MDRALRRMKVLHARRAYAFDGGQVYVETAARGRAARKVRGFLRRMEPGWMLTPRWSAPQSFLEDVALELAVGQPEIGCRTVSFRPLMGRSVPEAWNFILRVLAELPGRDWGTRPVPMVCDRRGFLYAATRLLDEAHETAEYRLALLGHGTEHLPVEVIDDLARVWRGYLEGAGEGRRCTVLFAGAVETPALQLGDVARFDLCDFGEAEAAASLLLRTGPMDGSTLDRAVQFTGGVPALVDALAAGAAEGGTLPGSPNGLLRCMGPVGEELRAAVSMAMTQTETSERLHELFDGEAHLEEPDLDRTLLMSGLVRRVRSAGFPRVALRSPAIAAVAG